MAAIYGHSWVSSYGPVDADDTWARGLAGLTAAEIAHGLKSCIIRSRDRLRYGDEDWPPTLGEFRAMCAYEKHRPAYHQAAARVEYWPDKLTPEQQRDIINGLCRSAGLPEKYPVREPGEDG